MTILDLFDDFPLDIYSLSIGAVILAAVVIAYKLLSRFISRTGKRLEMEPHVVNALRLILRVGAIVSASSAVFTIFELPTSMFVGGSALIGAVLGFGSSQTINNVVAGFYVLITQPFRVMDYVRIGDLEGQVAEITINYTNLYTPTFNLLKVPNTYVMNSRVLNMTHEGFIKYTFDLGFSHDIPSADIMERCIQPAIEEFQEKHEADQLRMPEAYLDDSDRLSLTFLFRFFIPKGDAKKLYILKPELLSMIMRRWDELKRS